MEIIEILGLFRLVKAFAVDLYGRGSMYRMEMGPHKTWCPIAVFPVPTLGSDLIPWAWRVWQGRG